LTRRSTLRCRPKGLFPEKRCPRRLVVTLVFRYRLPFGKEIKSERWVDEDVNLPEKRCPHRSIVNR